MHMDEVHKIMMTCSGYRYVLPNVPPATSNLHRAPPDLSGVVSLAVPTAGSRWLLDSSGGGGRRGGLSRRHCLGYGGRFAPIDGGWRRLLCPREPGSIAWECDRPHAPRVGTVPLAVYMDHLGKDYSGRPVVFGHFGLHSH